MQTLEQSQPTLTVSSPVACCRLCTPCSVNWRVSNCFCRHSVFSTIVLSTTMTVRGCFRASATLPTITCWTNLTDCLHTWPPVQVKWLRPTYTASCSVTLAMPSRTWRTMRRYATLSCCDTWWRTTSKSSTMPARSQWISSCSGWRVWPPVNSRTLQTPTNNKIR